MAVLPVAVAHRVVVAEEPHDHLERMAVHAVKRHDERVLPASDRSRAGRTARIRRACRRQATGTRGASGRSARPRGLAPVASVEASSSSSWASASWASMSASPFASEVREAVAEVLDAVVRCPRERTVGVLHGLANHLSRMEGEARRLAQRRRCAWSNRRRRPPRPRPAAGRRRARAPHGRPGRLRPRRRRRAPAHSRKYERDAHGRRASRRAAHPPGSERRATAGSPRLQSCGRATRSPCGMRVRAGPPMPCPGESTTRLGAAGGPRRGSVRGSSSRRCVGEGQEQSCDRRAPNRGRRGRRRRAAAAARLGR